MNQNIQPAFETPPYAETGSAQTGDPGTVLLKGNLLELSDADRVEVGFEYQLYGGFAEAMYNTQWQSTKLTSRTEPGPFQIPVQDLESGREYQYRAIVKHPKIVMRGDHKRFRAE